MSLEKLKAELVEGKLIKTEFGFKLNDLDGVYVASVETGSLSLENCEAIKRGFDLDELARQEAEKIHIKSSHEDWGIWEELVRDDARSIKIGMEKIIKLLGDKKFSSNDLYLAFEQGYGFADEKLISRKDDEECEYTFENLIQSLQQTEWDVTYSMRSKNIDELRESKEGFLHNPNLWIYETDSDGFVILKRK